MKRLPLLMALCALLVCSCSKDNPFDGNDGNDKTETPEAVPGYVTVNEDGTSTKGYTVTTINESNFFINYIKYTVVDGHLEVTGFDQLLFTGAADLINTLNYKGNVYTVAKIANAAFRGCKTLTSVTIPSTIIEIGQEAFSSCDALPSITIPASVTTIGKDAFKDSYSLTAINIDKGNPTYSSIDGVLFNKDATELMTYPRGKEGDYTVPSSVNYISETFIGNHRLTGITIPNSVVGFPGFMNCEALTTVTLPDNLVYLPSRCFEYCYSLTTVNIPSVVHIEESAFYSCPSLATLILPTNIRNIDYQAFAGCRSLTRVDCYATEPPRVHELSFFNLVQELHVPQGCKQTYEYSEFGRNFRKIYDDLTE